MSKCPLGHSSNNRQVVVYESLFGDLKGNPRILEICAVCGVLFQAKH